MPMMDPSPIERVLREAKISKPAAEKTTSDLLNDAGFDIESAIQTAVSVMNTSTKDSDRLSAAKLALELAGAWNQGKENKVPEITINIRSADGTQITSSIPGIILPREIKAVSAEG